MIKEVKRMTRKEGKVYFGKIGMYESALNKFVNALNYSTRYNNNYEYHINGLDIEYNTNDCTFTITNRVDTIMLHESYVENLIEKYM